MAMDFDGFRGSGGEATVGGPSAAEFSLPCDDKPRFVDQGFLDMFSIC
jgi:hypothetical protein